MSALTESVLQSLRDIIDSAPFVPSDFVLAFSGGLDSTVLLHVLATHREKFTGVPLRAVHINHALQSSADAWASHCKMLCETLSVPFETVTVRAKAQRGESPEDAARKARYTALEKLLPENAFMLLAQHQDDQAETLLLQLLRGAGVRGLAAMPRFAAFGAGLAVRPLLALTRTQLESYACEHQLQWVEDPSNADVRYDRNYLRQIVLPEIKKRWGSASVTLARSAENCAEAAQLIAEMAEEDLQKVQHHAQTTLSIEALKTLSLARQKNVLFAWLAQQNAPLPSRAQLEHVIQDVIQSKADASPMVHWFGVSVRRYRDQLLLQHDVLKNVPADFSTLWALESPLEIPGVGTLIAQQGVGEGLSARALAGKSLRVGFRRGGEQCKPAGDVLTRPLKKLMQTSVIPPWERANVPLLFIDEVLACVVGLCYCEPFAATPGEASVLITLVPSPKE